MAESLNRRLRLSVCRLFVVTLFAIFWIRLAAPQSPPDDSNPYFAAAVVHGRVTYLDYVQQFCGKEDPPSAEPIAAAVKTWRDRHARLYENALRIMRATYSEQELAALETEVRSGYDDFEKDEQKLPREERVSRCRGLSALVLSDDMSLLQRPRLVAALESFRE